MKEEFQRKKERMRQEQLREEALRAGAWSGDVLNVTNVEVHASYINFFIA